MNNRPTLTIAQFINLIVAECPFFNQMPEADIRRAAEIYVQEFFEGDMPAEWAFDDNDLLNAFRLMVPAYEIDRSNKGQMLIDGQTANLETIAEFFSNRNAEVLRSERIAFGRFPWYMQRAACRI